MRVDDNNNADPDLLAEEKALERAGRLHWFHWLVLAFSLVLTLSVWQYSSRQLQEKMDNRFTQQGEQIAALVKERLQKYEDALWSGVAAIHSHGGDISFADWQTFAEALHIGEKYPGINGIGVIHQVAPQQRQQYLALQRTERPDFQIHPSHDQNVLLPISYIIPVKGNAAAVGLDVAHENNRLTAALKSRDSATAQITGPIILVQDSLKKPGFLFYAPYYAGPATSVEERREAFSGLVYAPFVVEKLMRGTLQKSRRNIHFRILDQQQTLYDESADSENKSYQPRLSGRHTLSLYGRDWVLETWESKAFWADFSESQPQLILICGIVLDIMLLSLFLLLSRAQRRSLSFAKRMVGQATKRTDELRDAVKQLERSNQELEQFAFIASHDLQEPLRSVSNFSGMLKESLADNEKEHVRSAVFFISEATNRMQNLLTGLMDYSRISQEIEWESIDCDDVVDGVLADLSELIREKNAKVVVGPLPVIIAGRSQLRQLFQNLIANALKFSREDSTCKIEIAAKQSSSNWTFSIRDNGIGISPENFERIFFIFRRLHRNEEIPGSGIGLSSCRKITTLFGGDIWLDSTVGEGSCFYFTIPKAINKGA